MRCRHCWMLVLVALAVTVPAATGRADDPGPAVADPAGDCPASACADLSSVAPGVDSSGRLTFRFASVRPWYDFGNPPARALPQVSIWTTSPDSGPPDATVTVNEAQIAGGHSFAVHTTDLVNGVDYYGATTRIEMAIGEDDLPSFLTALGGPFRWRATLPGDAVPDGGSITFARPDADADGLPDSVDPCPALAFAAPAPGWSFDSGLDGCPADAAPFTASAFKHAVTKAAKAFRAQWRSHKRRAAAMRNGRIGFRLRIPAGRGELQAAITLRHLNAPYAPSVFGGRRCRAGRCVVRMTLKPNRVEAWRRKALVVEATFRAGRGPASVVTTARAPLRMPL